MDQQQDCEFSPLQTGTRGNLHGWVCVPDPSSLHAGLVLVHGLGEHAGRYRRAALAFAQHGIATLAFDQQGHGTSPGRRGSPRSYDSMLDDIESALHLLRDRTGDVPQFLFGHSMGGNLATSYVLRWRHRLRGLILSAPMMLPRNPPKRDHIFAAWITGRLFPFVRIRAPLDALRLTHDAAEVHDIVNDPLMHGKISLHLATQLIAQGRWILDHASQLNLPALLLHGADDTTTDVSASEAFCLRSGPQSTLQIFEAMYHDLLHETKWSDVAQRIIDWIKVIADANRKV